MLVALKVMNLKPSDYVDKSAGSCSPSLMSTAAEAESTAGGTVGPGLLRPGCATAQRPSLHLWGSLPAEAPQREIATVRMAQLGLGSVEALSEPFFWILGERIVSSFFNGASESPGT